jgi:hypothetical protein
MPRRSDLGGAFVMQMVNGDFGLSGSYTFRRINA